MTQLDMLKEQIEELKKEAEENREKFKKSFNENALETLVNLRAFNVHDVTYFQTINTSLTGVPCYKVQLLVQFEDNSTIMIELQDPNFKPVR